MKNITGLLILLAAAAFLVGSATAFMKTMFLLPPEGYWRGAVALLLFAITLMQWEKLK